MAHQVDSGKFKERPSVGLKMQGDLRFLNRLWSEVALMAPPIPAPLPPSLKIS
jgi:hypothetical protein